MDSIAEEVEEGVIVGRGLWNGNKIGVYQQRRKHYSSRNGEKQARKDGKGQHIWIRLEEMGDSINRNRVKYSSRKGIKE